MALAFRKRIKILPGVYVNLGKKSASVTVRAGGVGRTWSTNGTTTTSADLPGPLGYRTTRRRRRSR